jgi:ABC-type uncharacterized transport system substrate-binding protein
MRADWARGHSHHRPPRRAARYGCRPVVREGAPGRLHIAWLLVRPMRLRRFEAFRQGLRELGYVEGQNIVLESRWAEGQYARYPALAADLVRLKASVIVTVGGAGTTAAKQATRTIPIVMSAVIDPVENGLVSSLGPGGTSRGPRSWPRT